MSNSLFCCAAPRNATGGVLEWVNRTTIHPFCGLAIDIPESRSLTNGVRHQAPGQAVAAHPRTRCLCHVLVAPALQLVHDRTRGMTAAHTR